MADGRDAAPDAGEGNKPASKPRRPSFASPTKASLSRSNPDVIKRRSAQRQRAPGDDDEDPLASDPNGPSSERSAGNHDAERRGPQDGRPKNATARAIAGRAGQNGKPLDRPSPRPFPPRAQEDDDLIDPFQRRGLRRSPPPGVLPRVDREEPELPPTPTQAGLADPAAVVSSPSGIHSSPSKRAKRHRALSERIKSSPLKQPPLQVPEAQAEPPSPTAAKNSRLGEGRKHIVKAETLRRPHKARKVKDEDSFASVRGTRDSLLDEIASLKRDLAVLNKESERLYRSHQSQTTRPALETFSNIDNLIDVLSRSALPAEEKAPPSATEEWLETAMNPIALLPFGANLPLMLPTTTEANAQEEKEEPPVSHYPVAMNAEEELPYLQLFSNLAFRSSVSVIPRNVQSNTGDSTIMQKHNISISSTPPGLFAAKLDFTVNTKKLSITDIDVSRLEPAAASELGPFVRSIVDNKHDRSSSHIRSSALTRNLSVITWSMGEWVRLATKRAHFWCAVEQKLGTKEGIAKSVAAVRTGKKRKRRHQDSDDEDSENENDEAERRGRYTKAQLLPRMGQTSYDLRIAGPFTGPDDDVMPSIRILWTIEFDWTGEGQSKMGLQVETPPAWHEQDSNAKLDKIPGIFDKLVGDKVDPLDAVQTVVALLVGDGWK
ncbi:uncharacterized protein B0I36DRAFT_311592 [Microdochium trichocladiopsis]|uniref:Uncharacterized protein n=1 Tax=Microdochium trichocladiopsis TaxID=1682393 RepID=A0A9P8YFJ8_9PEZI|nr:uncharacterized protein B0I36DRAFT_311592 [Microdochium trichocladiopsis]KAH7040832.1 hypothetical protein B0I36DRAFT_311592 [Microdochium trichocladiopsis]